MGVSCAWEKTLGEIIQSKLYVQGHYRSRMGFVRPLGMFGSEMDYFMQRVVVIEENCKHFLRINIFFLPKMYSVVAKV